MFTKPIKLLSVDPGVTSGYAIIEIRNEDFKVIKYGEFRYLDSTHFQILKAIRAFDLVVIEDFVVRQSLIGDRLITVRVIGSIETAVVQGGREVLFQQPSHKSTCPDGMLVRLNLFNITKSPHIRDAFRHAVVAYIRIAKKRLRSSTVQSSPSTLKF